MTPDGGVADAWAQPADDARLFIALWPDRALRAALQAWSASCAWAADAQLVPAEKWHLTLHFLGNVPRERLPVLKQALPVRFAPFALALERPSVWPGQVAVLEAARSPPLVRLQAALGEVLQGLALPLAERDFRPHVTLARRAGSILLPETGPRLRWLVRGYALVESRPRPQNDYVVLQTCP